MVGSLLFIYIFIGFPLWYKLTTVYRAPLPRSYIESLHENKLNDIQISIPVFIKSEWYNFPDLWAATQLEVDHYLKERKLRVPFTLKLMPYNESFIEEAKAHGKHFHTVHISPGDFIYFTSAYDSLDSYVFTNDRGIVENDLPYFVAQTLIGHNFKLEWDSFAEGDFRENNSLAINYNPNVHVNLALLKGDGGPAMWEVRDTVVEYFTPLRQLLSPIFNFTVDTSIVYFNDLNLDALADAESEEAESMLSHIVDLSELSSMNYYNETVALNIALVFPKQELEWVERDSDQRFHTEWKFFEVPQWGSIAVNAFPLEDDTVVTDGFLASPMYTFTNELCELLGIIPIGSSSNSPLQAIESFKRVKTIENIEKAQETLWSLIKLTERFQQMAIPKEVQQDVEAALDKRLEILSILNDPERGDDTSWNEALFLSNELVQLAERAFFQGEMLQQNFFPQEHKFAVYMPLMGPLTVVLLSSVVALFKESREPKGSNDRASSTGEKKEKKEEENDDKDRKMDKKSEKMIAKEQEELKETRELDAVEGVDEIGDN